MTAKAVVIILGLVSVLFLPATKIAAQQSPVLVGAGDIGSCDGTNDEATGKLLDEIDGTVFAVGDIAYEDGTDGQFADCYDPAWGRFKPRTRPAPGNHEYHTSGASGYFNYFRTTAGEPGKGYYSYELGTWHIVVINSNCSDIGGCDAGSEQERWLRADLASHPSMCTLAYWHHPRFSSGKHGNDEGVAPVWQALYESGADVVVSGHDHDYERFGPQTPVGASDPQTGIREFVVGTGGKSLRPFKKSVANSEVRNSDTYGVIKLTLRPTDYDWEFLPAAGRTFRDSGTGSCHGAPSATANQLTPAGSTTAVQTAKSSGTRAALAILGGATAAGVALLSVAGAAWYLRRR